MLVLLHKYTSTQRGFIKQTCYLYCTPQRLTYKSECKDPRACLTACIYVCCKQSPYLQNEYLGKNKLNN